MFSLDRRKLLRHYSVGNTKTKQDALKMLSSLLPEPPKPKSKKKTKKK